MQVKPPRYSTRKQTTRHLQQRSSTMVMRRTEGVADPRAATTVVAIKIATRDRGAWFFKALRRGDTIPTGK